MPYKDLTTDQIKAIDRLLKDAFDGDAEADLVQKLRADGALEAEHLMPLSQIPLEMAGYIAYSGLSFETGKNDTVWGLAPMAIAPPLQGQGTGLEFLKQSLGRASGQGCRAVLLLGHVDFYQKAGFRPAADYGLKFCENAAINDHFMALELTPGGLEGISGLVSYHNAFYS